MRAATTTPTAVATADRTSRRTALITWGLLALYVAVLLVVSWKRWGNPLGDTGLDLTVAAGWLEGTVPYRDVRYWYGPLGIGVLAGAFAILGTHLWVAMAVGLAQTALIAELVRRLAGRWLPVPMVAAVIAVVLSIGFSGKGSNFQLPHTFAATTGLIALLFTLLALSRERFALAGLAVGAAALTRPEFLAFAVAAVGGAAFGAWRVHGLPAAIRSAAIAVGTTLLVSVPVLGWFGAEAGLYRVLFENIVPLEFLKTSGADFEHGQHPFDLLSLGMLLLRGAFLVAGCWVFVALWSAVADRRAGRPLGLPAGARRIWIGVAVAVVAGLACAVIAGQAMEPATQMKADITRFLIAMTALPAIGLAMLGVGARAWWRREPSPLDLPAAARPGQPGLGGTGLDAHADAVSEADARDDPDAATASAGPGWIAGGALIAAAAACSLRSYNSFSTDVYAVYYAPPVVLVAAIVLHRLVARRIPAGTIAAACLLVLGAASLSLHAYVGLYRDFTATVRTPNGSFRADAEAGPLMQGAFDLLADRVRPGDRMLAMPQEPGFYFLTGATPALYDATFLPGVLATAEDDRAAARALLTGAGVPRQNRPAPGRPYLPPRIVVETNWNFDLWGFRQQGVDVNVDLHRAAVDRYRVIGRFGDTRSLPPALQLGRAFTVYERR